MAEQKATNVTWHDHAVTSEEREQLKAQLAALEVEMDGYLKELGYE